MVTTNGAIANLGYSNVNLGSRFDFTFTLQKGINVGDSIKVNFPEGFYFIKPTCFHKNSGSYAQAETLYNNRMLICQSFEHEMAPNTPHALSIIGVVNPNHAGIFQGFSIETMEGLSPNITEKVSILGSVKINPGSATLNIQSQSLYLTVNTTHIFDLIFDDDVPATGEVWFKIPPGFRYLAANCTLLRPIEPQPESKPFFIE